jgi:Putative Flp pilus-assembly TadE/G-like
MRYKSEEGQAVVMVAVAMSIFLLAAIGLAIDGSHIYAQRQMAQTAADAAAQAGIMSIFDGTNAGGTAGFSTGSSFNCSTTDARTPCSYANKNGFGGTTNDTVTVSFPADSAAPGVTFAGSFPTNLIQVTVQRTVGTTLMHLLGPATSTVKATAMAAIVDVFAPVPILVTHPTLASSFSLSGNPKITICGGPRRSIQVNSGAGVAAGANGNPTVDLSHAGPPDPGDCSTGTGADFGVWGGPASPAFTYSGGSTGQYRQPASPILDPLANVAAPPVPTAAPAPTPLANGFSGCPTTQKISKPCMLYSPGLYTSGFDKMSTMNTAPVLKPGIYYIQTSTGFNCSANCDMYMATGFTDATTLWTGNVLIYNTGPAATPTNAGQFNLGADGSINLVGSPSGSSYKGILFFQDHNSVANTGNKNAHSLGGGGGLILKGTIYLNNTLATMKGDATHYQELDLQGTPGSTTLIQGEVIVGVLGLGGNAGITMNLNSTSTLDIRQVAMVN